MSFLQILQIIAFLAFPWLAMQIQRYSIGKWISPVVLSYGFGIALFNFTNFPVDASINKTLSEAMVLLAIPMLLIKTDFIEWLSFAKSTIFSFFLAVASVIFVTTCVGYWYLPQFEETAKMAGMITAVNIGGTPNMNAVGLALNASESLFVNLNVTDIVCGGTYLIFLTTIAHPILGYFMKDFDHASANDNFKYTNIYPARPMDYLQVGGIAIAIAALSVGITYLTTGGLQNIIVLILALTVLGVGASFYSPFRNIAGAIEMGNYLLMVFCVAIGAMADLSQVFNETGTVLTFVAICYLGTIFMHYSLAWLFGIDRDTLLITNTAAMYGPPFIGQIASVIGNPKLIFSGISSGLVGYAIGNILGILVAKFLM